MRGVPRARQAISVAPCGSMVMPRIAAARVTISVSMGVAVTDEHCVTADDLLHRADLAMYEAKRSGRGRLALHGPGTAELGGSAAAGGAA